MIHTVLTDAIHKLSDFDSSRLDAEVLLCHVLSVERSYLYTWPEQQLTWVQFDRFHTLLTRRIQGVPIAYLTGHKEFWSLDLLVNTNTLIPRPDTELLVEQALERLSPTSQVKIVDLGTGSGAIALAIATERPQCRILAIDKSLAALKVAQTNAQCLNLPSVEFLASDWWNAIGNLKATLIVTNPPYIAATDPHLRDIKLEPRSALVSGTDGLTAIRHIITTSVSHLVPQGWLLIEHGYNQAEAVQALFQQSAYEQVTTYRDLAGVLRVTGGQFSQSP